MVPKLTRTLWSWAWALLTLSCVSATFIVQQYEGDPLPGNRIAILRLIGGDEAYLASLDGEGLDFRVEAHTDRIHVEMLPGEHEVGISRQPHGRVVYRRFSAKPGVIYQPKVLHNRLGRGERGLELWSAGVFEVDPETGELVRDVSASPFPPPAALPPIEPLPPSDVVSEPSAAPSMSSSVPPVESVPSAPAATAVPSAVPTQPAAPAPAPARPSPRPVAPDEDVSAPAPEASAPPEAAAVGGPTPKPSPPERPAPTSPPVPTIPPPPDPPVPTTPPPPVPTTPPHPRPPTPKGR